MKGDCKMERKDLSKEEWREYDWDGRIYRIVAPIALWAGVTTHRVLDSNEVVHCVPNVGHMGCVLRWSNKDKKNPVNF